MSGLAKMKLYVTTATCYLWGGLLSTDVLCVTEYQARAFEAIENHDFEKVILDEIILPDNFKLEFGKRFKSIGIDEDGRAYYHEEVRAFIVDENGKAVDNLAMEPLSNEVELVYDIIEKELA